MGKKKENPAEQVTKTAQTRYEGTTTPTANETAFSPLADQMTSNYNAATGQNMQQYGDMMGSYNQFRQNMAPPTQFSFNKVGADRPKEMGEAYSGYRDFAQTGGYSPTDIQELRARGVSPIRAAYGNTQMQLDRQRSIGGQGGSPNYIAAASKAQRELPGQMADAMTGVNAGLADSIRQGKQFGVSGIGQLASGDAQRMLQAAMANQGADIQTQGMGENSLQNRQQTDLAAMGGQSSLYGTTPGLSSMFGNQALQGWQQKAGMEQMRNQFGMSLLDAQLRGYGTDKSTEGTPWWQKALQIGGQVAPYALAPFTGGASLAAAPFANSKMYSS